MCLAAPTITSSSLAVAHKARSSNVSPHECRHIVVQHHYKDHANDTPPVLDNILESLVHATSPSASFPFKLYDMLQRVEQEGHAHIVSFQPHGRCLVIHKPELMVDLLPTYFNLSKIPSFQRQLNLYGFRRLTKGPDRGGYYHEFFLRGKPFLIPRIHRLKVKGTGVRARSNPEQEPDFWAMPWVGLGGAGGGSGSSSSQVAVTEVLPCVTSSSTILAPSSVSVVSSDDHPDEQTDDENDRVVPEKEETSAAFTSSDVDDDDDDDDLANRDHDDDDSSTITYSSQCFEFTKALDYKDNMELDAWGMTFHFMSDIEVETTPVPEQSTTTIPCTTMNVEKDESWMDFVAEFVLEDSSDLQL